MNPEEPAQLVDGNDNDHACRRHQDGQGHADDDGDEGRERHGTSSDTRDDEREPVPDNDVNGRGNNCVERVENALGHDVGHADDPVVVGRELGDAHGHKTDKQADEDAARAQARDRHRRHGRTGGTGVRSERRRHEEVADQGDEPTLNHGDAQLLGVVVGHREAHEEAKQAHRELIGRVHDLIDGVGGLDPKRHVHDGADDLDDGADHDEAEGSAHTGTDGTEDGVLGNLGAPFLESLNELPVCELVDELFHGCS